MSEADKWLVSVGGSGEDDDFRVDVCAEHADAFQAMSLDEHGLLSIRYEHGSCLIWQHVPVDVILEMVARARQAYANDEGEWSPAFGGKAGA